MLVLATNNGLFVPTNGNDRKRRNGHPLYSQDNSMIRVIELCQIVSHRPNFSNLFTTDFYCTLLCCTVRYNETRATRYSWKRRPSPNKSNQSKNIPRQRKHCVRKPHTSHTAVALQNTAAKKCKRTNYPHIPCGRMLRAEMTMAVPVGHHQGLLRRLQTSWHIGKRSMGWLAVAQVVALRPASTSRRL